MLNLTDSDKLRKAVEGLRQSEELVKSALLVAKDYSLDPTLVTNLGTLLTTTGTVMADYQAKIRAL